MDDEVVEGINQDGGKSHSDAYVEDMGEWSRTRNLHEEDDIEGGNRNGSERQLPVSRRDGVREDWEELYADVVQKSQLGFRHCGQAWKVKKFPFYTSCEQRPPYPDGENGDMKRETTLMSCPVINLNPLTWP